MYIYGKYTGSQVGRITARQLKQVEQEVPCKDKLESTVNNCSCKFPGANLEALYFELVQGCILSSMV